MVCPVVFGKVIVLFDEDAASEGGAGDFAAAFVSHDAGSVVEVTTAEAYSGSVSASCTPSQSYNPTVECWEYPIDETPYLTFAWKKDGGTGIMVQFAHDSAWAYRYFSGVNVTNLEGIQLEDDIPAQWMSYTRNMVDDFGGGWNLTGIALTPWDGTAGYYDYLILHTEEDELTTAVTPDTKLATKWAEMK
jgi:hypothetical protein